MSDRMTRRQVCLALGVSEKTLYAWERSGRVRPPARDHRGWRSYGPRDVDRIRAILGKEKPSSEPSEAPAGKKRAPRLAGLSARNQLVGTIAGIRPEGLLSEVTVRLPGGQEVVAVITTGSVRRLGLAVGVKATAVIKSTEVMLYR